MNDDQAPFSLQSPEPGRRERHNARKRAWRKANPDKVRAIKKRCQDKDREKYLAQRKAIREAKGSEIAAKARAYREANPEKVKEAGVRFREKHRERINAKAKLVRPAKHLAKTYGLTPAEFQAIQDSQGGRCRICKAPFNPDLGGCHPCVDHEHATGRVRGVLCRLCNVGLGQMRDNPKLLRAAARYLELAAKSAV